MRLFVKQDYGFAYPGRIVIGELPQSGCLLSIVPTRRRITASHHNFASVATDNTTRFTHLPSSSSVREPILHIPAYRSHNLIHPNPSLHSFRPSSTRQTENSRKKREATHKCMDARARVAEASNDDMREEGEGLCEFA